jgi:3'-5' exonuclease
MNKIIFDIETVGFDFDKLDKDSREYLLKYAETSKEKEEVKSQLSFWPLSAEIVAIAMLNPDTDKGAVFFQAGGEKIKPFKEGEIEYRSGAEAEIISLFWKAVSSYDQFITFNGRQFDAPFLALRSAINKISPAKNLMPYRYSADIHIDLMDQMTFYGATRKFSLDFYARSFGIKSPKEGGIKGADVGKFYKEGKYLDIARYCARDVVATKELYEIWNKYINMGKNNGQY